MVAIERQQKIIEYVKAHQLASVAQLAHEFDVHEATIRRDLSFIEKEGILKRTHGGVKMAHDISSEPEFSTRAFERLEEKIHIGKVAASFIQNGDNIIIDSGTTTLQITDHLRDFDDLTVITNDINIASELRFYDNLKVFVTGGLLTPESFMLNGVYTDTMLRSLHVHKAFMGTPALHAEKGMTHFDDHLVPAKKEMVRAAEEVIVMTDHTKLGKISLHSVASTNEIHHLITDENIESKQLEAFEDSGVSVFKNC